MDDSPDAGHGSAVPLVAARPCPAAGKPYGGAPIDPVQPPQIDLFAENIGDPRNIPALLAAAAMFHANCFFHSPRGPALAAIRREYDLLLALETGPDTRNLFTYRPPKGQRIALFVGNERRGLSPGVRRAADALLRVPMRQAGVQSLNVAGAAAAALSQLRHATQRRSTVPIRRPGLVLAHPSDAAELGSALRTAWTLGWARVGLLDSRQVWFTRDRVTYVQGRGAARRHKNPVAVFPYDLTAADPTYDTLVVVAAQGAGPSFWRTPLPPGRHTAVVIPDGNGAAGSSPTACISAGQTVQHVTLDLPPRDRSYPYRLVTAVVLAELARRLGWDP